MNIGAAAKRYAEAFLEYSRETIGFEEGLKQLLSVREAFHENPGLRELMASPAVPYLEKCGSIDAIFKDGFSDDIRNFIKLLLKKSRVNIIVDIGEYARIKYAHGEEIDCLLKVSYPLSTEAIQSIKDALERKLNRKLHLSVDLDPDLLGGVSATIGNYVIDGSILRRFEDLRDQLMTAEVH